MILVQTILTSILLTIYQFIHHAFKVFQQIEIDEYEAGVIKGLPNPYNLASSSALRMYGVNKTGNSVLCNVHGFLPYFYAAAPYGLTQENVEQFRSSLDVNQLLICIHSLHSSLIT